MSSTVEKMDVESSKEPEAKRMKPERMITITCDNGNVSAVVPYHTATERCVYFRDYFEDPNVDLDEPICLGGITEFTDQKVPDQPIKFIGDYLNKVASGGEWTVKEKGKYDPVSTTRPLSDVMSKEMADYLDSWGKDCDRENPTNPQDPQLLKWGSLLMAALFVGEDALVRACAAKIARAMVPLKLEDRRECLPAFKAEMERRAKEKKEQEEKERLAKLEEKKATKEQEKKDEEEEEDSD